MHLEELTVVVGVFWYILQMIWKDKRVFWSIYVTIRYLDIHIFRIIFSGPRRKRGAEQHAGKGEYYNEEDARGMLPAGVSSK